MDNELYLGRALERLGDAALKEQEPDIGAAFLKFAVVTKELSALMKTLVRAQTVQMKFALKNAGDMQVTRNIPCCRGICFTSLVIAGKLFLPS